MYNKQQYKFILITEYRREITSSETSFDENSEKFIPQKTYILASQNLNIAIDKII